MLAVSIFGAVAMVWRGNQAVLVEDAHVRSDVLTGIQLLRDSSKKVSAPVNADFKAECQVVDPTRCQIANINAQLWLASDAPERHQVVMDVDPPEPTRKAIMAAGRWLLRASNASPRDLKEFMLLSDEQLRSRLGQRDPFRLSGCLLQEGALPRGCLTDEANDRTLKLQDARALDAALSNWRLPLRGQSPNMVPISRHAGANSILQPTLVQGRHVWIGIEPRVQQILQLMVACYTGDKAACSHCVWCNLEAALEMFEGARARMLGLIAIDPETGTVKAIASSHTPCFRKTALALKGGGCIQLPGRPGQPRPWMLENHALYSSFMPGSLVKVLLATGLLRSGLTLQERTKLSDYLVRSDTKGFIDLVLCKNAGFEKSCIQRRLASISKAASAMGWHTGDSAVLNEQGAKADQDILTGGQTTLQHRLPGGTFLTDGAGHSLVDKVPNLNTDTIKACYREGHAERWRGCKGLELVQIIAELYGQGNATASPLAIARTWSHLTAAAKGNGSSPVPHLVTSINLETGLPSIIKPTVPTYLTPDEAKTILAALSQTHIRGTARSSCEAAAKKSKGKLVCNGSDTVFNIFGKTGTPLFPGDQLSLPAWRARCQRIEGEFNRIADKRRVSVGLRHSWQRCRLSPLKWYAGQIAHGGQSLIVVAIAERNWRRATQRVDDALDRSSNIAAETALAFAVQSLSP
jgi:hypothetical protein